MNHSSSFPEAVDAARPQRLSISALRAQQISDVVALDQRCFGGLWSAEAYQREIDSPNSDLIGLEVERLSFSPDFSPEEGTAGPELIGLGCLWAILEEGHITLLGIAPDQQRRGLGQILLWQLLQRAHQRGLEWATLEVRATNRAALSLYSKLNFQSVGERKGYYADGESAKILWKKGLQTEQCRQELDALYRDCCERLKRFHWQLESAFL